MTGKDAGQRGQGRFPVKKMRIPAEGEPAVFLLHLANVRFRGAVT